ncbi:MAG: 6-hydroxymethylpterin diphosphokinase MptE-like protein, partial [Breznakiellaceae bacterium]
LRKFGKRWVSNLLHNLPEIQNTPGITYFSQKLQGIPTLIVAAGPSLDELRPFLKELYDRCCIIAVDTALRFLLQEGVAPDFVMVMDPQYWNYRHLDHCSLEQSVLITDTTVYPGVFRTKRGTTFFCNTPSPLGLWVEQSLAPRGLLGAGGSVATSAWDFARYTGAHPLWIGGLDLGFPDYQTHYKGALFEERTHTRAFRFRPQATELFQVLRSGNPRQRYAMDGQPLWTDERMLLYAHWFEERFAHYPEAVPRSLSSRGLAIRGLQKGSLEEFLAMPPQRQKINETLRQRVVEAQSQFEVTFPLSERKKILSQWIQRTWQELEHLEKDVDKIGLSSKRGWVPLCIENGQQPFPTTQPPSPGNTSTDQSFLYPQASPLSPLLDFVMASLQNEGSENPESSKIQSGSIQNPPLYPGTENPILQGINYLKTRLAPYLSL